MLETSSHLTVVFGNIHRRFNLEEQHSSELDSPFQAIKSMCKQYKAAPTEQLEHELNKYLDPSWREDIDQWLCRDIHGNIYLNDNPSNPLPAGVLAMVESYREQGSDLTPLKNFWALAQLNPNKEARNGLFTFIEQYGVPVTDGGYMMLYKAVENDDSQDELVRLIATKFVRIIQDGKSLSDYMVVEDHHNHMSPDNRYQVIDITAPHVEYWPADGGQAKGGEIVLLCEDEDGQAEYEVTLRVLGTLKELHHHYIVSPATENTIPEREVKFRPWYKHGEYGTDVALGKLITMPRDKCDPDITNECSHGLHVGSYEYVKRFARNDHSILACLVSPMDIVALPRYDNSKIRTCAYFPYGLMQRHDDGSWDEVEAAYWEEDFRQYEKQWLEEQIAYMKEVEHGEDSRQLSEKEQEEINAYQKRLINIQ